MIPIPHRHHRRPAERGAVLLVGMVMLLMVMLVAAGVIRLTMRHTQVVANEQVRSEATAAADYALDMVLNSPFTTWDGFKDAGQTQYVNVGTVAAADTTENSVAVTVSQLECRRTRIIKNAELIKSQTLPGGEVVAYVAGADASCFGGGGSPITIVDTASLGTPSGDSLCATVLYQVQAQPNDAKLLGASPTVVQGVEVRRSIDELAACD